MILATGLEGVTTEKAGRNQLMVSQEQMPFMFLVMHTLPEMKDLKHQHMMQTTEVTIKHREMA